MPLTGALAPVFYFLISLLYLSLNNRINNNQSLFAGRRKKLSQINPCSINLMKNSGVLFFME